MRIRKESVKGLLEPVVPPHLRDDPEDDLLIPEGKPLTRDSALFKIIGMFASGPEGPIDVWTNKHKYLAAAYADRGVSAGR